MDNDVEQRVKKLEDEVVLIQQRRTGQQMVIPDAIKMRHVGEGVRYLRSGLAANRPTSGEEPLQGSAVYFATDTNVLSIWDGNSWVEYNSPTAITVAGTYTPTASAEANTTVTPTAAQYMRVGTVVTVSGGFTADPTLTTTATSFELTLPISSNLGAVANLAGVAFCGAIVGQGAEVLGVVANDTAKVKWVSADITSQAWGYTYSYQIL